MSESELKPYRYGELHCKFKHLYHLVDASQRLVKERNIHDDTLDYFLLEVSEELDDLSRHYFDLNQQQSKADDLEIAHFVKTYIALPLDAQQAIKQVANVCQSSKEAVHG